MGLHFLACSQANERALLFGFNESPAALLRNAASFGIQLGALHAKGAFEIMWQPYGAFGLDELGYRLLGAVEKTKCKRLFVDGLGGFLFAPAIDERGRAFLATLANELRRLGTTTLIAVETDDVQGSIAPSASYGFSAIADNVLRLEVTKKDDRMRRLISLGKVRGSQLDVTQREVVLSDIGLSVQPEHPQSKAINQE
jgi:circadian clock protein KaiC